MFYNPQYKNVIQLDRRTTRISTLKIYFSLFLLTKFIGLRDSCILGGFLMEFHIARHVRDLYEFDESMFTFNGNVIFVNFHAARTFTQKMNQNKDLVNFPETAVKAGQVNAMGLIDEILHFVVKLYRETTNPDAMLKAYESIKADVGEQAVYETLHRFVTDFPPVTVYKEEITVENYLRGNTGGVSNQVIALEEMLMLWIANKNRAHIPFLELFDHSNLVSDTAYREIIKSLHNFFDDQPPFRPKKPESH